MLDNTVTSLPSIHRNVIAVLLDAVPYDKVMPDDKVLLKEINDTLKFLIETNPSSIVGLERGYTLDAFGSRSFDISSPIIGWQDTTGQPIRGFFERYHQLMTKYGPLTFNVMFFEPDATQSIVLDAWFFTDMQITRIYIPGGRRNFMTCQEPAEIKAHLSYHTEQRCDTTKLLAQKLLSEMAVASGNPMKRIFSHDAISVPGAAWLHN
jgi:hypothetical protein